MAVSVAAGSAPSGRRREPAGRPDISGNQCEVVSNREAVAAARETFLSELPSATLRAILAGAEIHLLAKRETVFQEGDPASSLILLLKGDLLLYGLGHDGRERALEVLQPVAAVAPWAPLAKTPHTASARALAPARLLLLPAAQLRREAGRDPRLGMILRELLARQAAAYLEQIKQLKLRPVSQRLGCYLLSLTDRDSGSAEVLLPCKKRLVAAQLGMTPESLSRAFTLLKQVDVSMVGSRVSLSNIERLQALSHPRTSLRSTAHASSL